MHKQHLGRDFSKEQSVDKLTVEKVRKSLNLATEFTAYHLTAVPMLCIFRSTKPQIFTCLCV
jgi:hypothetical protein